MTTPPFTRRGLLKGAVAGSLALTSSEMDWAHGKPAKNELIVQENRLPGTRDWMLGNTRVDPASKYRCPQIEGYCSHTSIRAGETIQFYISTNPASSYS